MIATLNYVLHIGSQEGTIENAYSFDKLEAFIPISILEFYVVQKEDIIVYLKGHWAQC